MIQKSKPAIIAMHARDPQKINLERDEGEQDSNFGRLKKIIITTKKPGKNDIFVFIKIWGGLAGTEICFKERMGKDSFPKLMT